jgi:methionyl-tRNA formyltransferase
MNEFEHADARIIYISCGSNGMFGLSRLIESGYRNIHIITINRSIAEAANVSGYADFGDFAAAHDLPVHYMSKYSFIDSDHALIAEWKPEVILVNGWNRLVPASIFNLAPRGGYGVHAGHPPRGRGRAPVAWTLIKGLRDLEVYLFQLDERADAGAIIGSQRVEVTQFDTAQSLYDKVALAISLLYKRYLPGILRGDSSRIVQDERWATEFPKRTPVDGLIDWSRPDHELYNFIRAQSSPYPGAFTFYKTRKLIVWKSRPFDRILPFPLESAPGEILEVITSGVVVRTGTSPLLLSRLRFDGEEVDLQPPFDFFKSDFIRGERLDTR